MVNAAVIKSEVAHSEFSGSNLFARFEIFLRSRKTSQELTGEAKSTRSRYVPARRHFAVFRVFGVSKNQ
jgi:hypothetical protein